MAMNDFLLGRLQLAEGDALYESTRVSLERRADGRPVDVYEMYWADLSRLGEGGLRALTSLYQLFFHLNTLGADIVDQCRSPCAAAPAGACFSALHAWLAWLMKVPMALLQLCMLMLVLFGVASLVGWTGSAGATTGRPVRAGGVVLAALGVMGWLRARTAARAFRRWLLVVFPAGDAKLGAGGIPAEHRGLAAPHLLWGDSAGDGAGRLVAYRTLLRCRARRATTRPRPRHCHDSRRVRGGLSPACMRSRPSSSG
jgi:hypothetical protein